MKRLIIFILFLVIANSEFSRAQIIERSSIDSSQVTRLVKDNFSIRYGSEVKDQQWFKVGELSYEVRFNFRTKIYESLFRSDGKLIQQKYIVQLKDIPQTVLEEVGKDHVGFSMITSYIEEIDNKPSFYIFYLETDNERRVAKYEY